jgi:hypothetical protein
MSEVFAQYANTVGIVGVVFTLTAYYLLNVNKLSSVSMTYLLLNCVGSSCVLYSLMFHWNLSSVITEAAWISISIIGIYRVARSRQQNKDMRNNIYLISDVNKGKQYSFEQSSLQ